MRSLPKGGWNRRPMLQSCATCRCPKDRCWRRHVRRPSAIRSCACRAAEGADAEGIESPTARHGDVMCDRGRRAQTLAAVLVRARDAIATQPSPTPRDRSALDDRLDSLPCEPELPMPRKSDQVVSPVASSASPAWAMDGGSRPAHAPRMNREQTNLARWLVCDLQSGDSSDVRTGQ